MKKKNVRMKQARKYHRYLNKVRDNNPGDWIFDPWSVARTLTPRMFVWRRGQYENYDHWVYRVRSREMTEGFNEKVAVVLHDIAKMEGGA